MITRGADADLQQQVLLSLIMQRLAVDAKDEEKKKKRKSQNANDYTQDKYRKPGEPTQAEKDDPIVSSSPLGPDVAYDKTVNLKALLGLLPEDSAAQVRAILQSVQNLQNVR